MSILESDASLLDGLSKTSRIVERIKDINTQGCAISDHGSISNNVRFLQDMKKAGKKPILGCELYICDQDASVRNKENRYLAHLPVLAKNTAGWNSLVKAVSESNKPEHYYHRPRLSLEQLSKYTKDGNIIGFSGHLGSHVSDAIENYGIEGGKKAALILQEVFGKENFWLECQLMDQIVTPKQLEITAAVRKISQLTGIPCIATPDAHYAYKQDAVLQRILLCSNMGVNFEKGRSPDFGMNTFFLSDCFHIPSYQEMLEYGHTEEELENTNRILEQIEDYDILKAPMLKRFDCPEGRTPDEHLRHLCREGWKKLILPKVPKKKHQIYLDRIKTELEVFEGAGLASYFLMVQDILQFVNDNNWLPGPGRGSAAGCLVSYLIGITKIDPIKYDLMFERFYNAGRNTKDRVSMPDIDVDVPIKHRGDVIEYIKQKYGEEHVSQMITFQTMKGARALKEVFRAYGDVSFDFINEITKNIVEESKIADKLQEMEDPSIIKWCLENRAKDFKDWCQIDKDGQLTGEYADRFELAIKLEGTKAAQSKHAAGIIVAPQPLSELCPMVYDSKTKKQVAGMEMNDLESIGLIKFDILGVAMLDKVMCIRDLLKKRNIDFDPDMEKFDMYCDKTWHLMSEGNTKGVFQLESRFGQKECKNLKPENMEQLAALSAILRPGCIGKDVKVITNANLETAQQQGRNRYQKISIENLYKKFENKNKQFIPKIISYNEATHKLFHNKITNMWHNGVRKVYQIKYKTRSRSKIFTSDLQCTSDHPVFVANYGWKQVQDLIEGDRILILSSCGLNPIKTDVNYHKAHSEICFHNYKYKCVCCDWNEGSLDVNHLEGNRNTNNSPENLCYLCPNHHRMYTENKLCKEDIVKLRSKVTLRTDNPRLKWCHFVSLEYVGEQDVYDIEVEGPHHNFIAGNTIVHNCSEAKKEDGKTIKDHYILKKHKQEEVEYIDEVLRPILGSSYGEMIYQEQAMKIAQVVAGFDLQQADVLRKAIGKKDTKIMAEVKTDFLKGCEKSGVINEKVAHELFDWIEKSQRYSFNKSHAVSYAYNSYLSAYCKAHFKKEFFTSYLRFAHDKIKPQQEIYELVNNAKAMNLFVRPPNIKVLNPQFDIFKKDILFGLCDVKNVGDSVIEKLNDTVKYASEKLNKNFIDFTWIEFLVYIAPFVKVNALEALINVGACDCFKQSRTKMLLDTTIIRKLSKREMAWTLNNSELWIKEGSLDNLLVAITNQPAGKLGACANKNRLEKVQGLLTSLRNPAYSLDDKSHQISQMEYELLGVNITATMLDECNTKYKANCSCLEYTQGFGDKGNKIMIAAKIDSVRKYKTKNGKNPGQEMAFIEASDETGSIDSAIIFPDYWSDYKNMVVEGNRLLLCGRKDGDNSSFIVELVEQL